MDAPYHWSMRGTPRPYILRVSLIDQPPYILGSWSRLSISFLPVGLDPGLVVLRWGFPSTLCNNQGPVQIPSHQSKPPTRGCLILDAPYHWSMRGTPRPYILRVSLIDQPPYILGSWSRLSISFLPVGLDPGSVVLRWGFPSTLYNNQGPVQIPSHQSKPPTRGCLILDAPYHWSMRGTPRPYILRVSLIDQPPYILGSWSRLSISFLPVGLDPGSVVLRWGFPSTLYNNQGPVQIPSHQSKPPTRGCLILDAPYHWSMRGTPRPYILRVSLIDQPPYILGSWSRLSISFLPVGLDPGLVVLRWGFPSTLYNNQGPVQIPSHQSKPPTRGCLILDAPYHWSMRGTPRPYILRVSLIDQPPYILGSWSRLSISFLPVGLDPGSVVLRWGFPSTLYNNQGPVQIPSHQSKPPTRGCLILDAPYHWSMRGTPDHIFSESH